MEYTISNSYMYIYIYIFYPKSSSFYKSSTWNLIIQKEEEEKRKEFLPPSLSFFSRGNLISQASLVDARRISDACLTASIPKMLSQEEETNPWTSELTSFHLSAPPLRRYTRPRHVSFVRTYDKPKSHHPRDLDAITRAKVPSRRASSTRPYIRLNDQIMIKDTVPAILQSLSTPIPSKFNRVELLDRLWKFIGTSRVHFPFVVWKQIYPW